MPKVAAIQMCSSASVDENLAMAGKLLEHAAANGAELVVLPEMFPIMGASPTDKVKIKETFGTGKIQDFLAAQAAKHHIWLVGGTIPISCANNDKVSAACIVYNNKGHAVARYDKIHLFDVTLSDKESYNESATIVAGNKLTVVDTPVGKLGLSVCYDIRFPALFTYLFNQGAEIIAIPSAFTLKTGKAHWKLLARSRAVENFCYVIGACQSGTHADGRKTYGHTLIVDPWGIIVEELTDPGVGVAYCDIDLQALHKIRASIPVASQQKIIPDISKL